MSLWSRIVNVFRRERLTREIDEELESHIFEAIVEGRDPGEARAALGARFSHRETSRDIRLIPWIESLYSDAVFGLRQILKRKVTSAASILSLALAIGSCMAAFRIVDAVLWRPLPIEAPERLYALSREFASNSGTGDNFEYPLFRQMRSVTKDQADLIAVSNADRIDLTYSSDGESERAYQQYISGVMFQSFGILPAAGRLLSENDDVTPGAHPYAVLSYDYWKRRFAMDPAVVGRTFRTGNSVFQIIGVAAGPFTGTEPGIITDIFIPTMMMKNNAISRSDYQWFRTFVHLKPRVRMSLVLDKLQPLFKRFVEERAAVSVGPRRGQRLLASPAASGVSGTQQEYRTALIVLGVLVLLVLLISCANVANLMMAQAMSRQREMALRISIGAGRMRLVQLVVIECAWLAFFATCLGACFAWSVAPRIVDMIGAPGNPIRLMLPGEWRLLGFGGILALGVTILFGLLPALRASAVKPAGALKGGEPRARSRSMQVLIAAQVSFCVFVLFVAGLFLTTSSRLAHQHTGFSADRLLAVEAVTPQPQPGVVWSQVANQLRNLPGIEAVGLCEWPLMAGGSWNGFISVNGFPPAQIASYFLAVSSEWRDVMKIPLLQGRDLRSDESSPGSALVNEAFSREYFGGNNPVGRVFETVTNEGVRVRYSVAGLVADARYRNMREPVQPTAYFPFRGKYERGSFMVRTANPDALSSLSALRSAVTGARHEFLVSTVLTQTELIEQHTVRERLLAKLAIFFGAIALTLAGVGLYGVLDYSVLERRRELAIRLAIGAQPNDVARSVMKNAVILVCIGSVFGVVLGVTSVRFIEALLFDVKATDPDILAWPALAMLAVALVAALPALLRAVRIDPIRILRAE